MVLPSSRYFGTGVAVLVTPEGKEMNYLRRRFLPQPSAGTGLAVHTVAEGDRLDILAARYFGDPELFWKICDANTAMRPEDLTATTGKYLLIPLVTGG